MRHRVYGKHLGRDKNQRTALFRGLVRGLVLEESITTTSAKSKAIKGLVDHLVSKAKEGSPASVRVIRSFLPQAEVSKKLFETIAPRYKERVSGFTEVVRLGRRVGDGSMMVKMSFVEEASEKEPVKEVKEKKPRTAKIKKEVES